MGDRDRIEIFTENWYALALWIVEGTTSESVLKRMGLTEDWFESLRRPAVDRGAEMVRMRAEGKQYKEIGRAFGVSADAAYRRIKRFKEKEQAERGTEQCL